MPEQAKLILPNGKIMTAKKFAKKFPAFAEEMDGSAPECTLSWYFEYKSENNLFAPKDPDAEDELAEILGVTTEIVSEMEESNDSTNSKALSKEQVADFKQQLSDIKDELKKHYGTNKISALE